MKLYPPEADSIMIPIMYFVMLWLAAAPFYWTGVWFALRRYPGSVSLVAWNSGRPSWSVLWTIAAAAVAIILILLILTLLSVSVPRPLLWDDWPNFVFAAAAFWLLLVLRSATVARSRAVPRGQSGAAAGGQPLIG